MQVIKTSISQTKLTLTIRAGPPELEPIRRHVLGHFIDRVKIPGFRPGKAPLNLIEKNIDQKAFSDEFLEHAINDLYAKALDSQNLRVMSRPNVRLKKFVPFTELEFEAEIETLAPIKLASYKNIRLKKPTITVTAKDIKDVLQSLAERAAERTSVDRPATQGDEVVIDFNGKDENSTPVNGADGKDFPLLLGSNAFVPGFEDNLIGAKAGQSLKFAITFPANYGVAALQNKKVTFTVDVKAVNELSKAKIDDSLAKKVGPFASLGELKADIKKQLTVERLQQMQRDYESRLVREITEKSDLDVPASLVEEQLAQMEEEEKRNLTYRGETWQEHLKSEDVTQEQHRERQKPIAAERVKAGLVLSEIANRENLKVMPGEVEARLKTLKGQYQDPAMRAELDKPENKQDIAARILTEKTIEKLTGYANR